MVLWFLLLFVVYSCHGGEKLKTPQAEKNLPWISDIPAAEEQREELPWSIHTLWVLPCTRSAKISALQQV